MVVLITHVKIKSYAFKIGQINQTFFSGLFFFLFALGSGWSFIYLYTLINIIILKYIVVFDFQKRKNGFLL